jgi:hypothetical protein
LKLCKKIYKKKKKMSVIQIRRSLKDFHNEVKEIEAQRDKQKKELHRCKKVLLDLSKKLQCISFQSTARSGYFMRMTPSNCEQLMKLPFMSNDGVNVYERLVEIPGISSFRSNIPKFLKAFYKCLPDLPELLAKLPSKNFGNQPFLPEGLKLSDFIACSTFPALFGHLYTSELKMCYINFLVNVAKSLPKEAFNNFREHWLFECIKSYIHSSNVQLFLRRSLGDIISKILKDNELVNLMRQRNNQVLFNKITVIVKEMIEKMAENFCIFPDDVRYLIHSFAETASDEDTKIKRIELIFIDTILVPAISLPKSYGVLPPTMYFDVTPLGPARVLQVVAQSFRFIHHPSQAEDRYQGVNIKALTQLPFKQFLQSAALKTLNVTGIKLQETLDVLNVFNVVTLYSIPDVISLVFITKQLSLTSKTTHQDLAKSIRDIPVTDSVPFNYFRFEHFGLSDFALVNPRIKEPSPAQKLVSKQAQAANALYRLLSFMPVKQNAPKDTNEFIMYHQTQGQLESNYQHLTHLQHFVNVKNSIGEDDFDIIPSLEEIIRRWRQYLEENEVLIELAAKQISAVEKETSKYMRSIDEWLPIYHSSLLERFLSNNPTILTNFKEKKNDMIIVRSIFEDFFTSSIKQLKKFVDEIEPQQYMYVARNFHSYLMANMSYNSFKMQHMPYVKIDEKCNEMKEKIIQKLCFDNVPQKIKKMFNFPLIFKFAIIEIQNAEAVEIPIEAISCILRATQLLRKTFELEIGGMPQADDINPLLTYCLLSSSIKGIYSFGKYIEFYLYLILDNEYKFLTDEMYSTLSQFISRVNELDNVMSTM